jgi:tRNA uridine 5-carbamoylmethylation protein Kti12
MKKNTIIINLFGGPGVGKSTLCATIFSTLKMKGIECEMALEYAKDVVWEESFRKLNNQVYVFGKQHSRIWRLNGKVDVIITDSPLLNSIVYDSENNIQLHNLVISEFKKLNTLNYYIDRSFKYEETGRVQTYDEALEKDRVYKKILEDNDIVYEHIKPGSENLSLIMQQVEDRLNYQVGN